MYKVLFLCTGNSARSQMAEVALNRFGKDKYIASSAGSQPREKVDPYALKAIENSGFSTESLYPKEMNQFENEEFDFIITLCDKMKENCPIFPNRPIYAHWGMPDPASFVGSPEEKTECFNRTFQEICNRIHLFMNVKIEKRDRIEIEKELGEIANTWKYIR